MCDKGHLQLRSGRRPYDRPHFSFLFFFGTEMTMAGNSAPVISFSKSQRGRWSDEAT